MLIVMRPTDERSITIKRRRIFVRIFLPMFMGFAAFMNIVGEPRFQSIRNVDVVRLIAIGACWGVSLVGLVVLIQSKFRKAR